MKYTYWLKPYTQDVYPWKDTVMLIIYEAISFLVQVLNVSLDTNSILIADSDL
jgi:hypothetical protein